MSFIFSFVRVPECAYCTPSFSALNRLRNVLIVLLYYTYVTSFNFVFVLRKLRMDHIMYIFCLYFTLAKDGVKHHCIYVYRFKKKNHPSFGLGKNSKVMPQLSRYLSFLLGKGRNPYFSNPIKSYKTCKCAFWPITLTMH